MKPKLGISMGDPAGVGPEIITRALAKISEQQNAEYIVFGDLEVLARHASAEQEIVEIKDLSNYSNKDGSKILVHAVSQLSAFEPASPNPQTDRAQIDYIEAVFDAITLGHIDAMVTAPINKKAIHRAGSKWPGHTEMLAGLCSKKGAHLKPVMMLAGPHLRTVPVTTHIAVKDVSAALSQERLHDTLMVVADAMKRFFAVETPRIAVAGLNPHAGEGGLFGFEEAACIAPAIAQASEDLGFEIFGPLPGDSVFREAAAGEYDVVLGMYHDQALIPIKLLDFDHAVNITLGLPIIRTSVDHGTAYDIAGKGIASASSMIAALNTAEQMVRSSKP